MRKRRGIPDLAARIGLISGRPVCLVTKPAFVSAYYLAYGSEGEAPLPDWLDGIGWSSWFTGSSALSTHNKRCDGRGVGLMGGPS